jgi:hypothetical protein
MGSKPRNSKPSRRRKLAPPPSPPPARCKVDFDQVDRQLQDARSVLAVAVRALDECIDPSQVDVQEEFDASDVAVVVRMGIAQLNRARETLDAMTPLSPATRSHT